MYEIRYTKGGEKDYVKLMRSPYADIASGILEQLKADPYSNSGGGLEKVDDGTGHDSQADLTIYFQDGDGDIGLDETDRNPVFAVDSPYYYNFFINLYEKQNGEWVELDLPTPLHARVPHLSDDVPESIEGKLSITTFINNPYSTYDTVRLTCWLVDRALHHSDTITTPEIIVKK